MKINISIVIVNFNVKELILNCIKSILLNRNKEIGIEIIVVDNASVDGSVSEIRKQFPEVLLIENKENLGFSAANNQGMRLAKGEFIFLLNPDTEIIGDAIYALYDFLKKNKSFSVVGPQLLNTDGSLQVSTWKKHSVVNLVLETFLLNRYIKILHYPLQKLQSTFETQTLLGAALFFKKDLLEKIGMLDEQFFYMEDVDFCQRAQKIGSVYYLNNSRIIHHGGKSQHKNYNATISNQMISKLKFYKKHHSKGVFYLGLTFAYLFVTSRIIAFSLLSNKRKQKQLSYLFTFRKMNNYLFKKQTTIEMS